MNKDRLTKERRSWNMSRVRGKDTKPEKVVRSMLHKMGYRFRLHVKIPVPDFLNFPLRRRFICPDIILPKYKTAIFVHGCFWHRHKGCKDCTTPTHRREWWLTNFCFIAVSFFHSDEFTTEDFDTVNLQRDCWPFVTPSFSAVTICWHFCWHFSVSLA